MSAAKTALYGAIVIAWLSVGMGIACASDAFFAPDGKTVTLAISSGVSSLAPDGKTVVFVYSSRLGFVNVETGAFTPIALPRALQDGAITSIARGAEGETLFLAKGAVWVIKGQEPAREVCRTSPLLKATDLVVVTHDDPSLKDWMMVSAVEKPSEPGARERGLTLYARKPGDKEFRGLFCRRTPNVTSGTYTPDGRFFFVCENDIWEGHVFAEPEDDPDAWKGVLTAVRVAPLSVLSTDLANAGAMWVQEVAVAGKWVYATMSGHHMGAIVRAPMPARPIAKVPSVTEQYQLMAGVLAKAEVITQDFEQGSNFCVCEVKGKTRLFFTQRRDLMLWEGKGKPRVIGHLPEP